MKKSGYLDRVKKQREREDAITRHLTRQEMMDFASIALHIEFGFGPERIKRFVATMNGLILETCANIDEDTKDLEYTVAKHEEALKEACGPYYVPRGERYGY